MVICRHRSGLVILGEEHLLFRPLHQPPLTHPALERAPMLLRNPVGMGGQQMGKERPRFQFGRCAQHLQRPRPDRFQRVFPGPPCVRLRPLFEGVALPQMLAGGVAGHARFHGTHTDGCSLVALVNELRELGSFDHNPRQHAPPRPVSNHVPQSTESAPENHPIRGQF